MLWWLSNFIDHAFQSVQCHFQYKKPYCNWVDWPSSWKSNKQYLQYERAISNIWFWKHIPYLIEMRKTKNQNRKCLIRVLLCLTFYSFRFRVSLGVCEIYMAQPSWKGLIWKSKPYAFRDSRLFLMLKQIMSNNVRALILIWGRFS